MENIEKQGREGDLEEKAQEVQQYQWDEENALQWRERKQKEEDGKQKIKEKI